MEKPAAPATGTPRARRGGYRGEPSRTRYTPLLPGQRLCLALITEGRRCVQPRRHKGECK